MPGKYKSEEIRKLIVEAKQKGETNKDIAERFHVGRATIQRTSARWKATRSVKNKKKTGRPRKTTPRQARVLVRLVKKDPFLTVIDVQNYAQDNLNLTISHTTARRILASVGLRGRKPAKKPWISKKNRVARMKFAKDHEHWTVLQWSRILWKLRITCLDRMVLSSCDAQRENVLTPNIRCQQ